MGKWHDIEQRRGPTRAPRWTGDALTPPVARCAASAAPLELMMTARPAFDYLLGATAECLSRGLRRDHSAPTRADAHPTLRLTCRSGWRAGEAPRWMKGGDVFHRALERTRHHHTRPYDRPP